MKKLLAIIFTSVFVLSACGIPASVVPATATLTSARTETPVPTRTLVPTHTPVIPSPSATISPLALERPVFLAWPLPSTIGTARISQYPNTPWTWNYLGLNEGYRCPPMFGYLLDLASLPYWRDVSIPEEQDKAQADPHNFEMVECYSTEGAAGANGHEGTDIKAPAGTPVYAGAEGKIQEWRSSGLIGMVVLKHCIGGTWDADHQCVDGRQWYTTYMHIVPDQNLLQENAEIARGAQLGTIYDQTINSHLHFEVGLDKRSYANFANPWGLDHTPWLGCMWLDQSICVNPDPDYKRAAFYTVAERLFIKPGDGEPVEVYGAQGIKQIRLWGDRIAVIDPKNNLLIREGKYAGQSLSDDLANWKIAAGNILDFQIANRRVAILDGNRNLLVKENGPEGEWAFQAENVRAFSISDHRVGYLTNDGDLLVKEGGLENSWVAIAKDVLAFQLIDNRIAFIDQQGNLQANEEEMLSEYKPMANNVKAFQLTNVRLGIIDMDNNLLVKEGNLRANWVLQAENVQSFQLAGYRVLVFGEDGVFKYKEGSLYQKWNDLPFADLKGVFFNGEMPVYVD